MRLSSVSPPAQGPKNCANSQLTRSSRSHPCHSLLYQKGFLGVPAVAQQDWHLCSARIQDRSPTWHSGLKDPALPKLPEVAHLWVGSDPWPGSSKSRRMGEKKKGFPCEQLLYTECFQNNTCNCFTCQENQNPETKKLLSNYFYLSYIPFSPTLQLWLQISRPLFYQSFDLKRRKRVRK